MIKYRLKHPNIATSSFILEQSEGYKDGPGDSYYKYFDDEKHWYDAQKHCEEQDAHLVIDNSEEIHDYITDKFKKHFWIGATDMEKEGEWKWVDGEEVDKAFWEDGQPGIDGQDEDCALMLGNEWHDASCENHKAPYVCQKRGL